MRETSLDEFVGEGSESDSGGDADVDREVSSDSDVDSEDAGAVAGDDASAAESLVPTFDWTPGGATCAACEDAAERRWRQDGVLVCPACKTW